MAQETSRNSNLIATPDRSLPLVEWDLPEGEWGTGRIVCTAEAIAPFVSGWVVVDLLRGQLDGDKWVGLRAVRTTRFAAPRRPDLTLVKTEITLEIRCREGKALLKQALPRLIPLVRMASHLEDYRRYLNAVNHFQPSEKIRELWRLCALLHCRWPRQVGSELIEDLHQFLAVTSETFREARTPRHMIRITTALHLHGRQVGWNAAESPRKRHLRIRLFPASLQFPYGVKAVTAVIVTQNVDRECERFGLSHLMRAITAVVPGIAVVTGSYFSHQRGHHPIRLVYVEVEHSQGRRLSLSEIRALRKELPRECQEHVEYLTNAVFAYRNDEEIYRAVLTLSRELQYVKDMPQLMLFFDGQDRKNLVFAVTLVRLLGRTTEPIESVLARWPMAVHCEIEEVKVVGYLRKKYPKQGVVFRLKFPKKPFLRKNGSLDLRRARLFVGSVLTAAVGEVRDYNGGLLLKQNEVLDAARALLAPHEQKQAHFLESLFDGLAPTATQSFLPPTVLVELYRLLLGALEVPQDHQTRFSVYSQERQGWVILLVKAEEGSYCSVLKAALDRLDLDTFDLAETHLNIHGTNCVGYVYNGQDPQDQIAFKQCVQNSLEQWSTRIQRQQRLRLCMAPRRPALDPRLRMTRRSGSLMKMLYEGLTRLGQDDRAELALAHHVEVAGDGRRYTFHLRESLWCNGIPLVAEDFAYSWRQILNPNVVSRYAFLLYPILGARAAKEGRLPVDCVGIRAVGSHTLVVDLEHPTAYFLDLTAHWVYSPLFRQIDKTFPDWANSTSDSYVCNGPFKPASTQVSGRIRLIGNTQYWDAHKVRLEQIDIHTAEEPDLALKRFEEGAIDWLGDPVADIPHSALKRLEAEGKLQSPPSTGLHWLMVNTQKRPFTSQKVRRALATAINRRQLIERSLHCGETPSFSVLPQEMSCLDTPFFPDGDLQLARNLWTQGMEELGCSADTLPPITISHRNREGHDLVANEIARQWREAFGIAVYLESISWPLDPLRPDYDVAGLTWYGYKNGPMFTLKHLRNRDACLNATGWEDAEYQAILDAADRCVDPIAREAILKRAEEFLMNHMPLIPLYHHRHHFVSRPEVRGILTSSLGHIDLKQAYIE